MKQDPLQQALQLAAQGQARQATALLQDLADQHPADPRPLYHLARLARKAGDLAGAVDLLRRSAARGPEFPEAHYTLGSLLFQQGRAEEAEKAFRQVLTVLPGHKESLARLGLLLGQRGQWAESGQMLRQALQMDPNQARAWFGLGNAALGLGDLAEAEQAFGQALRLDPGIKEAAQNLGNILYGQKRSDQAAQVFRQALLHAPGHFPLLWGLALSLNQKGDLAAAVEAYRAAHAANPEHQLCLNNLAVCLKNLGQNDQAELAFLKALRNGAPFALGELNLGNLYRDQNRPLLALPCYLKALEIEPENGEARNNLAAVWHNLGRPDLAQVHFQVLCRQKPQSAEAARNRINNLHYLADRGLDHISQLTRSWAQDFLPPCGRRVLPPPRPAGRLRLGFIGAELRNHPVGHFVEPFLAHLDQERFEPFCYDNFFANPDQVDAASQRLRQLAPNFRFIKNLSDQQAFDLIREDGIHILIDLTGLTLNNRLALLAARPAPLQATWLGYFGTTGAPAMDYFICDEVVIPPEHEPLYSETPLRPERGYVCFAPPPLELAPGPLPALSAGRVTFGCFNRTHKLTDRTIALWAGILAALPDSRLLLKAGSARLDQPDTAGWFRERFMAAGVAPERLLFEGPSSRAEMFRSYQRVDIALDPTPFSSTMITAEALWMGLPVVSLLGDRYAGRMSAGVCGRAGFDWMVTRDDRAYRDLAVSLAGDLSALAEIRAGLRGKLLASPLCDQAGFAQSLQKALLGAWRETAGQ